MFPAVWVWDRDFYEDDFAGYVDGVVVDELVRRAAASVAAGGTPSPPRTLADYADIGPAATPAC
jgi:hypothetical protein